jgi:MarR family transcriptional regulator, organic hydroperoxide resistance regulator
LFVAFCPGNDDVRCRCICCKRKNSEESVPGPRLNLSDYLPYLINRVGSALVARFTADALAARNLTIDMWRVLVALSNNGGQRQIDLAGLTSIDTSTLSRLVTRLVRRGLVTRIRSERSSREVLVRLTANGKALVGRLIPIALRLEAVAMAGIAARDLSTTKRTLRRMYQRLTVPRRRRA